jgi:RHS repeat-associated protein
MGCKKLTYGRQGKEGSTVFINRGLGKKGASLKKRHDYYPFGMSTRPQRSIGGQTTSVWAADSTGINNYLFNGGSELNTTTNNYQTAFRDYDPALGRMTGIDIMANKYSSVSPYNYAFNDPIGLNDPSSGAEPYGYGGGANPGGWSFENGDWYDNRPPQYWQSNLSNPGMLYGGSGIDWGNPEAMWNRWKIKEVFSNVNVILLVGTYDVKWDDIPDGTTIIYQVGSIQEGTLKVNSLAGLGSNISNIFLLTHGLVTSKGESTNGLSSKAGNLQYKDLNAFMRFGEGAMENNPRQLGMSEAMSLEMFKTLTSLKSIGDNIEEGGSLILGACVAGAGCDGEKLGTKFVNFFNNRIDVLLNADYTSMNLGPSMKTKNYYDPNTGKRWSETERVPNQIFDRSLSREYIFGWIRFTRDGGISYIGEIYLTPDKKFINKID